MSPHFWRGFTKQASKDRDFTAGEAALAAGGLATGVGAVRTGVQQSKIHAAEKALAQSRSFNDFISKLEPGDVIFSRSINKKRKRRVDLHDIVQSGSGSPHVHTQVYQGRGNTLDIGGPNMKGEASKAYAHLGAGNDLIAYRANTSKKSRQRASQRANVLRGAEYVSEPKFVGRGAQALLGAPGRACNISSKGGLICNDVALKAHSDTFKKRHQTIADMKANKNMSPVARLSKLKPSLRDTITHRGVYPVLKNLKWGVGAGALAGAAIGAKKIIDSFKGGPTNPSKAPAPQMAGAPAAPTA